MFPLRKTLLFEIRNLPASTRIVWLWRYCTLDSRLVEL